MAESTTPAPTEATIVAEAEMTTTESPLVVDDLLIEDVSIDGMCGVY